MEHIMYFVVRWQIQLISYLTHKSHYTEGTIIKGLELLNSIVPDGRLPVRL